MIAKRALFHFTDFTNFRLYRLRFCFRAKSGEEGEDDARSACPSDTLGYTRDTMAVTTGRNAERRSKSL